MNKNELIERSTGRYFDRITVATDRVEELVKNLTELYDLGGWECGNNDIEAFGRCWFENVELRLVDARDDSFPVKRYFADKGEGICCVRENVPAERWDAELARYEKLGVKVIYREKEGEDETLWLDTFDKFGGYIAIHCGEVRSADQILGSNPRHMCQINITTDNVDRTVAELTELLEIGPWSIGTLNNQTISDAGLLVDGEMICPEFHFQLGITFFSNIEFEVIEPVKGPTVYRSYMDTHGIGFHHIKEIYPPEKWNEIMDTEVSWKNEYDGGPHEANFLKLDCSKLKITFGWKPRWSLQTAMKKIVEWTKIYANDGDICECMNEQIKDFFDIR